MARQGRFSPAGTLLEHGFVELVPIEEGETVIELADDFDLEPGRWRLVDGEYVAVVEVIPSTPPEITAEQLLTAMLAKGMIDCPTRSEVLLEPTIPAMDAVHFDGATHIEWETPLTGVNNGKKGIFATQVRFSSDEGQPLFQGTNIGPQIPVYLTVIPALTTLFCQLNNSFNENILSISGGEVASATWYNILISWDLEEQDAVQLWISDVSAISFQTFTNELVNYEGAARWTIGFDDTITADMDMAFLYFNPAEHLDFSIESNRRRFFSSTGKIVPIGADGVGGTGTVPSVYFYIARGEAPANFLINRGSGGGPWTLVGGPLTTVTPP